MIIPSLSSIVTGPTLSHNNVSFSFNLYIISDVLVPLWAACLFGVFGRYSVPSHEIYFRSNWLKMFRINAQSVSAKMVDLQAVRYRSNMELIGKSVGVKLLSSGFFYGVFSIINRGIFRISKSTGTGPNPTPFKFFNVPQKERTVVIEHLFVSFIHFFHWPVVPYEGGLCKGL